MVTDDTDWEVGNEIVVTTTSYEAWHTETFSIVAVVDTKTFELNGTFQFQHLCKFSVWFPVVLLCVKFRTKTSDAECDYKQNISFL